MYQISAITDKYWIMQVYTASTTSEMKHNAHNENNKPIHQNIQYTQNRFKQVNWTSKNYVHVVHVVIVPLLSLYQCHCFCQIGLLTVQMDYSTDAIFPQLSKHHLA